MGRWLALAGVALLCSAPGASAQGPVFGPETLPMLRRVAAFPGDRPAAVRVITLAPGRGALSGMVEGGGPDSITVGYPAFQVRFPHGWIVVDPMIDPAYARKTPGRTLSLPAFDTIQQAMVGARLVLLTHEHPDHIAGLLRSPLLAQVSPHTLLTPAQVRTLIEQPFDTTLRLDAAAAARYMVKDYQSWLPVAPGVVLLKAPGHTPGSQLLYIHLASGRELILSGDIAWAMAGITSARQKPPAIRQKLAEDTAALGPELRWLRDVSRAGVAVVVSHDDTSIDELVRRGVLKRGFDLSRQTQPANALERYWRTE